MDDGKRTVKVDGKPVNYSMLPEHIRDGLFRYVEQRIPTGSGLRRLLENGPVADAWFGVDTNCQREFDGILKWIHNNAPSECHGSPEAVKAWLAGRKR